MPVFIAMLRGVNVGGHNLIRMEDLRKLCLGLGLSNPRTYVQSGNIVFGSKERDLSLLSRRIAGAVESKFGFCPEVIIRTTSGLRDALNRNPFSRRRDIEPGKLLINFLSAPPTLETRDGILALTLGPEEIHIDACEIYIYFPDGMGRSKLWPAIGRKLKNTGTGRNLNTVAKLLQMAEQLEAEG